MSSEIWRVSPQRDLHTLRFEQEVVVFDAASGDTHLLSTDAARILDALSSPLTLAALNTAQPDIPAPDVLLHALEKIGLVCSA